MHSSVIFFYATLAFLCGVGLGSFFAVDCGLMASFALIASSAVLLVWWRARLAWVVVLWVFCFVGGVWHMVQAFDDAQSKTVLDQHEVHLSGRVVKEPVRRTRGQNVVVELLSATEVKRHGITSASVEHIAPQELPNGKQRVLLQVSRHADVAYGDILTFSCTLEVPENFDDDFDYRMYLAKDRIYYQCKRPTYRRSGYAPNAILAGIASLRVQMEAHINQSIPQPQAALANGLLFGGDDRLSQEIQDTFARTGMSHIVAVSGYNVTVIVHVLTSVGIALGLWRRQAIWLSMVGIILFVAMIGFPASGVRAAIMGILVLVAVQYGRVTNALGATLFAGALMLLFNPLLLRYDIGFQLSFLATLGLIMCYPLFDRWFVQRARMMGLTEIICLTLAAQVFVLPVIFYNFETFSIVSLLANVLVLLIVPLSMLFAFLTAVGGFLSLHISTVTGWVAYILIAYEIAAIEALAEIPWASVPVTWMQPWHAVVYYAVVLGGLQWWRRAGAKNEDLS